MRKISIIIILIISCFNLFAQNKIDRHGNKKGTWYIYYTIKEKKYYDPKKEIENIKESLIETEQIKAESQDEYYYEKCTYKEGIKNGLFEIFKCIKKPKFMKSVVVRGTYVNGKVNGKMSTTNFVIDYTNDRISDQIIDTVLSSNEHRNYIAKISYKNNRIDKIYYAYNTPYLYSKEGNKYKFLYITDDDFIMIRETDSTFNNVKVKNQYIYYYSKYNKMGDKSIEEIKKQMSNLNTTNILDTTNYYPSEIKTANNNNILDGIYKSFYIDGKLRESFTFKNGHLEGKAEVYISNKDNYVYNFPKEIIDYNKVRSINDIYYEQESTFYDVKTNPENVMDVIHHKNTSYLIPLVVILKSIKDHKTEYTTDDISDYFKMTELYYTYDSVSNISSVNDYNIYYNNQPILKRIINAGEKGLQIFDKNGVVLLDNNKLEKESIQEYQKNVENINKVLESDRSCEWCSKKIKVKEGVFLEVCKCYNEKRMQNESFSISSPKFFCSRKCMADAEKECCSDNGLIKR